MIKGILSMIVCVGACLPCLLIVSESDTFWPNLAGFIYVSILYFISRTKVAKNVLKHAYKANYKLGCWLFNK